MNIDFQSDDSFTVLFGPSGAGKSMTLQMIAGLQTPDQGFIAVGNRMLFDASSGTNQKPQQRNIGYVFQDYALFPHLNVEKNIAFGLRKRWHPFLHRRDRLRITEVLAMLEIESSICHSQTIRTFRWTATAWSSAGKSVGYAAGPAAAG